MANLLARKQIGVAGTTFLVGHFPLPRVYRKAPGIRGLKQMSDRTLERPNRGTSRRRLVRGCRTRRVTRQAGAMARASLSGFESGATTCGKEDRGRMTSYHGYLQKVLVLLFFRLMSIDSEKTCHFGSTKTRHRSITTADRAGAGESAVRAV